MIKGSIQEDIKTVNIYAPNIGAPQYIRQPLTDIKGEIDSNTIIAGERPTHTNGQIIKTDPERCCGEGGGRGVHVWERM